MEIQALLGKNDKLFGPLPIGIPLNSVFEHVIVIEEGSNHMITTPYRNLNKFKDKIGNTIKELLKIGNIRPSSSPFASSMVLVKNKDGTMKMCIDYRELEYNTIKNWYMIPMINELIDELHGVVYFSKIDLRLGYHKI
jgi:hypothetical protein